MAREDGMGGGLSKKKEKFDFPEKAFGAGKAPKKKRGAAKKGTGKTTMKTKGKGPAKTVAEAKRRGLSTFTDKSGKKKAAVTAEELKKSGLSLRDYLNKQQGKTRAAPKAPTTKPTSKPKKATSGNKFLQASAKNVGKTKPTPVQVGLGSGKAAAPKKTPVQQPMGSGVRGNQPLGTGRREKKDTSTPYTPIGMKAGGMKKGYKMGGMKKGYSMGGMKKKGMAAGGLNAAIKMVDKKKKGMAAGGMKKKGYSMGGMRKKGFSAGKSVRGVGKATKGFRPVKMVMMTKGGKKGGKRRS